MKCLKIVKKVVFVIFIKLRAFMNKLPSRKQRGI